MNRDLRAWRAVPRWMWAALGACFALHLAGRAAGPAPAEEREALPPAPRPAALRLATFGEDAAGARLLALHLQAYDAGRFDAKRLAAWLDGALLLDPRSGYPLFLASRVFAETPDPARARAMLDFVHRRFLDDPNRRWPWLAHAALLAKHRLRDLPLARRYAADLQRRVTDPAVPLWATQMEIFILEDMNELEAARIMLGGLLASGRVRDPAEARFLKERLEVLEAKSLPERGR